MYSPIFAVQSTRNATGHSKGEGKIFKVTFHDTFRSPCITRGNEIESDAPKDKTGGTS